MRIYPYEKSLEYLSPELAREWHPIKNGSLKPSDVNAWSKKYVWWYLPYDDPETGKHFDFEWKATVYSRYSGIGCPYLCGKKVWIGYNDLMTTHPDLCKEWNYKRNGNITPYNITKGSTKKVWWYLSYDDPETGKHFDFEWEDTVNHRTSINNKRNCPFLSGRKIWIGYNDLMTTHPDLCKEWNYKRNKNITPYNITKGSTKKVWWYLSYDDTETGKHFDFEWEETISNRALHGFGCPFLSGQAVWQGYNDLATTHPNIAKLWNYSKNAYTPQEVTFGYDKKVWWHLPYDDEKTGKHFDFEWETRIINLVRGGGCPFLSGHAVWKGYNDLATTHPDIAKLWDYDENGELTPYDISAGFSKKINWILPYDDPETGKHFDFKWKTKVINLVKGRKCPYLSGQAVWQGYNDLATTHPQIAKYWNYEKNKNLLPTQVSKGYIHEVWWKYPYDDPKTGKHFDFEWKKSVNSMIGKNSKFSCPYLVNQKIWPGYNDFGTFYDYLLEEWDYDKNLNKKPHNYGVGSYKKVWWKCNDCGHRWRQSIVARTKGSMCPKCRTNNKR